MKQKKKQFSSLISAGILLLSTMSLFACGKQEPLDRNIQDPPEQQAFVTVQRGSLTPTMSAQTTVIQAMPFVISAPTQGYFECLVSEGQKIAAGTIIGKAGNAVLRTPCDATVRHTAENGDVPKNYPVITLQYTGFSLQIVADSFLQSLPENAELRARFQVKDGIGPTDILAVVIPSDEFGTPQTNTLQCLIGQKDDVCCGQSATVVVSAETRKEVLLLPLSVVSGRRNSGSVTLIQGGKNIETEVQLGCSDGAYIEILSGVGEGDAVSEIPPNLDPRRND